MLPVPVLKEALKTAPMKVVAYATLILSALIVIIILVIVLLVYQKWQLVKNKIRRAKNSLLKLLPKLVHVEYTNIKYPRKLKSHSPDSVEFNNEIALFLIKIINSCYNIAGGFNSLLPSYVTFISRIGTNGYLFKVSSTSEKYIIAYRGTMSGEDVMTDIDFSQSSMQGNGLRSNKDNGILVHRGFYKLWDGQKDQILDIASALKDANHIYVTGHSLGGASAALTALELSNLIPESKINLYMFAPPRCGNDGFTETLNSNVPHNWAIVNACDVVCALPPSDICTFGGPWLYDNYRKRYLLDIETGSLLDNHHLDTYAKALGESDSVSKITEHWNRKPIVIM